MASVWRLYLHCIAERRFFISWKLIRWSCCWLTSIIDSIHIHVIVIYIVVAQLYLAFFMHIGWVTGWEMHGLWSGGWEMVDQRSPAYHHTTSPFYGPFSGTTRVCRCQKRTSGLHVAREDTPTIRLGATQSRLTSAHHHPARSPA